MTASRTPRTRKPATPKDKLADAAKATDAPPAEQAIDGFVVQTIQDEQGNVETRVAPLGIRRITEAPVFLKKALAAVNESLGID